MTHTHKHSDIQSLIKAADISTATNPIKRCNRVMDPATSPPLYLALDRPTHSESEIAEDPWLAVEPIIYDIFASVIESDGAQDTLACAAQDINVLFFQFGGESTSGGFFWGLWWLLHDMAVKLPWEGVYQDKLIDLLISLRDLSNPFEIEVPEWWAANLWTDLPLLGANAREEYDQHKNPKKLTQEGLSMDAFIARYTQHGISNFAWLGLGVFHGALEVEPRRRSKRYKNQGPELAITVPPTLVWLQCAGERLYEEVVVGADSDPSEGCNMGGRWKGKSGYSPERWDFWKKRYQEIAVHQQASKETKSLARKARGMMLELERKET